MEDRGRKTEGGRQRTEGGGQKTEDGRQRTEDGRKRTEDRRRRTEGKSKKLNRFLGCARNDGESDWRVFLEIAAAFGLTMTF